MRIFDEKGNELDIGEVIYSLFEEVANNSGEDIDDIYLRTFKTPESWAELLKI